jgi:hypothetical protein
MDKPKRANEGWVTWLPLLALLVSLAWTVAQAVHMPHAPVGFNIGVLAFMACVATIWPPTEAWPKAAWVAVFGILLVAEITTLYEQRADDQESDRKNRREENDRFAGLLKTQQESFGTVLSGNQRQFEATLKRFDAVLAKSQEAISVTTGGNTFPFVMPADNPMPDGKHEIGFWLQRQGGYSLYRVWVYVWRAYRSRSDPKQSRGSGTSMRRDEFGTGAGSVFIASFPEPVESPTYYVADMTARNGQWEEIIEVRAIGSTHTSHYAVYGSTSLNYGMFGPYTKILDLADSDFPPSSRKDLVYPIDPQLLPLEPLTQHLR